MSKQKRSIDEPIEESANAEDDKEALALSEPIEEEPTPQPVSIEPRAIPQNSSPAAVPSLGKKVWQVIVFLFNLVLIVLIVSVIGIGIYIGWPIVYERYILPVQNHTSQIAKIETESQGTKTQINALQTQVAAALAERTNQTDAMNELDGRLGTLLETQTALQNVISVQSGSLAALKETQSALQNHDLAMNSEIERQIKMLRGMELLSRARLFLYQSNFGLAKQDIQAARDILAAVQPTAPEPLEGELKEVLSRLDMCLSRLPEFPVPASQDLDIAWQILLQVTPLPALSTETPTPTVIPDLTEPVVPESTPTGIPQATPTSTPQS